MTYNFKTKGEYLVRGNYYEHVWEIEFDKSGESVVKIILDKTDVTNVYLNKDKTHKDYYKIIRNVNFYKNVEKREPQMACCYVIRQKSLRMRKSYSIFNKSKSFASSYFGIWVDNQNEHIQDELMKEYNNKLEEILLLEEENRKILEKLKSLYVNKPVKSDSETAKENKFEKRR